jgi:hypothetical protein
MEHGKSLPREIVLLTLQSTTESIDARVYMSVVQYEEWVFRISLRDIHDA